MFTHQRMYHNAHKGLFHANKANIDLRGIEVKTCTCVHNNKSLNKI